MKIVSAETIADLVARAASAPRKRMNLDLHQELSDPTGRFLNVGLVGTYVRPHRHPTDKWELLSVLQGRLDVVTFTASGAVKNRVSLRAESPGVIEIPGGEWHGFVYHAPAAVVLHIKSGPYEPEFDKEFSEWAPTEDDEMSANFLNWLTAAGVGQTWSDAQHGARARSKLQASVAGDTT
jgi:cupin fold WbuC family metalloprotein